ncbi:MAG: immunoglobulin domain-containing protein [Verrucomicrobiota bacterium]
MCCLGFRRIGLLLVCVVGLFGSLSVAAQTLLLEYWTNRPGNYVSDLTTDPRFPWNPSGSLSLNSFNMPAGYSTANFGTSINYGTRVRGYVVPPMSGYYTFWICSDDLSQLFLSTDSYVSNKTAIVSANSVVTWQKWTNGSAPIYLASGNAYYIEALQKQGTGGEYLSVAWTMPDGTTNGPISGSYLLPYAINTNPPVVIGQPQDVTVEEGGTAVFGVLASGEEPFTYQWLRNDEYLIGEFTPTLTYDRARLEEDGTQFRCIVANPFGTAYSASATLHVNVETTPPTIIALEPPANVTLRVLSQVTVLFSEPVTGLKASDLLVNGQPAAIVSGYNTGPYLFQFAVPSNGLVHFEWSTNHHITDFSFNSNRFAGGSWDVTLDPLAPTGDVVINEFMAGNENGIRDEDGDRNGWIELYNRGTTSVNLYGYALTDNKDSPDGWVFPDMTIAPGQYLMVWASGKDRTNVIGTNWCHTNFKLSMYGEDLAIFSPDSPRQPVHVIKSFPEQRINYSYGLDATGTNRYFLTATPGGPNSTNIAQGFALDPHFSVPRGFFTNYFNLQLSCETTGAIIRYTLDGSEPTDSNGIVYSNKFVPTNSISTNAGLVRAVAFKTGLLPSTTITHSYFFNQNSIIRSLPVLSITTAQTNLTGRTGIGGMSGGAFPNGGIWVATSPDDYYNFTNRTIAWERPVSVELMNATDNSGFAVECGFRIQGSDFMRPRYTLTSKTSYRMYFRGDYGPGKLDYPWFPTSPMTLHDQVVLRAGHNDMSNPFINDELARRLFSDMGQITPQGEFVNYFLNGVYKGYYNPVERNESDFFKQCYGTTNNFDVIGVKSDPIDGDLVAWNQLKNYMWSNNLAIPSNYIQAATMLDVTNFADYILLYMNNASHDWPGNNWRTSRERCPTGIFRFSTWDSEMSFNTCGGGAVTEDSFNYILGASPGSSTTEIVRFLYALTNAPEFRLLFTDRIRKHFFNDGALIGNNVSNRFNAMRTELSGVIPSMNAAILTFAASRATNLFEQFKTNGFGAFTNAPGFNQYGGVVARGFGIVMTNAAGGTIYYTTNGLDPRVMFAGVVHSSAIAYTNGQPVVLPANATIKARTLLGTNWSAVTVATFTVANIGSPLRITELMYGAYGGQQYEYLELANISGQIVDLSGASFSGIDFTFPPRTYMGPGERWVLANGKKPSQFAARYPGVAVAGWYGGALANEGERISLQDADGNVLCSVDYLANAGWPEVVDTFYSIELIDPYGDQKAAANWQASAYNGSPGQPNTVLPLPAVRLNEVMAYNTGTITNDTNYPDWVELFNGGSQTVNLTNWSLTVDANKRKFVLTTNAILNPGEYLVIWCDTNYSDPGLHTGFGLGRSGENLFLYDQNTNRVDAVAFGVQIPYYSVGRDSNQVWQLTQPTPGSNNQVAATATASNLWINEWLASSPGGSDWLELYNRSTNLPVTLKGIYLGTNTMPQQIRSLSFIEPGGYIRFYADALPGADHLDFKISASGGNLYFYDDVGILRQTASFGPQLENVSIGSLPDGSTNFVQFFGSQSPGAPNYLPTSVGLVINEVMARNENAISNRYGHAADWIEIFNPTSNTVSLAGMSLSIDTMQAGQWVFPAGVALAPQRYLVVWCDPNAPASTSYNLELNSGQALDGDGTSVYLFDTNGVTVDFIQFGPQIANRSIGRYTNTWALLRQPTPGAPNTPPATLGNPLNVRFNEWFASPAVGGDWFELFNPGSLPVTVTGLYLTDDPSILGAAKHKIAALAFLDAAGYARFIADTQTEKGANHTSFSLDGMGELLILYNTNFTIIDMVDIRQQPLGLGEGRFVVNGSNIISFTALGTPGASNTLLLGPAILTNPAPQTVGVGSIVVFSVTASSGGLLAYQWFYNGNALSNATNNLLLLSAVQPAQAGGYSVAVADNLGTVTSTVASLTIVTPPAIVTSPSNHTIIAGSNCTLAVVASGTYPLWYQWVFNGTTVPDAAGNTLSLYNVQANQAGSYAVLVSNAAGVVTSDAALLTVLSPPSITQQPLSQQVLSSSTVTWTVLANGTAPLQYQWCFNGTNLTGAVAAALSLTNVSTTQAGGYSVIVTNGLGAITSVVATLGVDVPPAIVTQPQSQSAPTGATVQFSVVASGATPLFYQWRRYGTNLAGAQASSFELLQAQINQSGPYSVIVSNAFGTITSTVAFLTVFEPPTITAPTNVTINVNAGSCTTTNVNLGTPLASASAGVASLTNNAPVAFPTGTNVVVWTITDNATHTASATQLVVVIDNLAPVILAYPTNLAVNANGACLATLPSFTSQILYSDNCTNVTVTQSPPPGTVVDTPQTNVTLTVSDGYNQVSAVAQVFVVNLCRSGKPLILSTNRMVNSLVPSMDRSGLASAIEFGSAVGLVTNVAVRLKVSGSWNGDLYCYLSHGTNLAMLLNRVGRDGVRYWGYGDPGLDVTLDDTAANGDIHVYRQTLFGNHNTPLSEALTGSWAPDGRTADPESVTNTSPRIASLSAFNGSDPNGTWTLFIADADSGLDSTLTSWGLEINGVAYPPTIIQQPASRQAIVGQTVTFSVTASTMTPATYQWQLSGTNLPNANSPVLTLDHVQTNQAGPYTVVVTNAAGSVTSLVASLTVLIPPVITLSPVSQSVYAGQNVNFTVAATSSAPLTYQWYGKGMMLSGQTNTTLTLANVQAAQEGIYYAIATNLYGQAVSSEALLALRLLPPSATPGYLYFYNGTNNCIFHPTNSVVGAGQLSTLNSNTVSFGTLRLSLYYGTNGGPLQTNLNDVRAWNWDGANNGESGISGNALLAETDKGIIGFAALFGGQFSAGNNNVTAYRTDAATNYSAQVRVWDSGAGDGSPTWESFQQKLTAGTLPIGTLYGLSPIFTQTASNPNKTPIPDAPAALTMPYWQLTTVTAQPPVIILQPVNQTVLVGQATAFTVSARGTAPLHYQWYHDGNLEAGAQSSGYIFTNASLSQGGNYYVVVSNAYGSITSAVATLAVWAAPTITAEPQSATNLAGTTASFNVGANGSPVPWYQWYKSVDSNPWSVIGGATNCQLSVASCQLSDAGNYSVVVTNAAGTITSAVATLSVWSAPVIVTQPQNQTNFVGTIVSFSVIANGSPALWYQWWYEGTALPNQTNAALILPNVQMTNAGNYSVVITNNVASVTSMVASLAVMVPPFFTLPPISQSVYAGQNASFTVAATNPAPLTYQWYGNGTLLSGQTNTTLTLTNVQAAQEGNYYAVAANSFSQTTSSVALLALRILPPSSAPGYFSFQNIATNRIFHPTNTPVGSGQTSSLKSTTVPFGSLRISIYYGVGRVPLQTNLNDVRAWNWTGSNSGNSGISGNALLAETSKGIIGFNNFGGGQFSPGTGSTNAYRTDSLGSCPMQVRVWDSAAGDGSPTWESFQQKLNAGTLPIGTLYGLSTIYTQAVSNPNNIPSPDMPTTLSMPYWQLTSVTARPPVITIQPLSQTNLMGTTVNFNVSATGNPAPWYQWYKSVTSNQWSIISGATNSQWSISNCQLSDAGNYTVVVTNVAGTVTSAVATLTVLSYPIITADPQGLFTNAGVLVTLTTTIIGAEPLSYRWYRAPATLLTGSTSNTLCLSNLQLSDSGGYFIVASNSVGQATSSVAQLRISTFGVALNNTNLTWNNSGQTPWFLVTNIAHDANEAARSGATLAQQASILETTVTGPGLVTFWWKVSSATNQGIFTFAYSGVAQESISGEVNWFKRNFLIPSGSQTLRWSYTNLDGTVAGANAGWLDQVGFGPIQVQMQSPAPTNHLFHMKIETELGRTYTLEYKDTLTDDHWSVIHPATGDGSTQLLTDTNAVGAKRFYRIRAE